MRIKDFVVALNKARFIDSVVIISHGKELWKGYSYEDRIYKYLEDELIEEVYINTDGNLCIIVDCD